MDRNSILTAAGLFLAAFVLIGFILWQVSRTGEMEADLLTQLDEMAELDMELCPFDGEHIQTSRAILYDFSDPLPRKLSDYPSRLLDNMLDELAEAERFDRFSLYALNPFGRAPKSLSAFCVPVTINQIPRDMRKALWGRDPEQHAQLPDRYSRFAEVFERLWGNERELDNSMKETMSVLTRQARGGQSYSRIIENIEEIALTEIDRGSQTIKITILSNMLQNSPQYSHYRESWEFENYLSTRNDEPVDMSNIEIDVYYIQSCETLESAKRRNLRRFWEDYFEHSQARKPRFRTLNFDGEGCVDQSAVQPLTARSNAEKETQAETDFATSSAAQGSDPEASTDKTVGTRDEIPNLATDKSAAKVSEQMPGVPSDGSPTQDPADPQPMAANNALVASNLEAATEIPGSELVPEVELDSIRKDCPKPKQRNRPPLDYPKRATGNAKLSYRVELDMEGVPVSHELYGLEAGSRRSERLFKKQAEDYISKLRFDVHAAENCSGGQTANVVLKF